MYPMDSLSERNFGVIRAIMTSKGLDRPRADSKESRTDPKSKNLGSTVVDPYFIRLSSRPNVKEYWVEKHLSTQRNPQSIMGE